MKLIQVVKDSMIKVGARYNYLAPAFQFVSGIRPTASRLKKNPGQTKNGSGKELIGNSEYKRYINFEGQAAAIIEEKIRQAELFEYIFCLELNKNALFSQLIRI
ncbi:MAG TPA: hypothetical protein VN374_04965 [Desulfitobacteriaceae bacterium]|nr:hypothetical protein [Desulfitobacteriaceae bacterium]